jgi:hypothetical protein
MQARLAAHLRNVQSKAAVSVKHAIDDTRRSRKPALRSLPNGSMQPFDKPFAQR